MGNICNCCGKELKPDWHYCSECWDTLIQERDSYLEALNKQQEAIDKLEEENQRLREELNAERRNQR